MKAETVIKQNKDVNRFWLVDALALAAVFLDGRLSKHFQGQELDGLSVCAPLLQHTSALHGRPSLLMR